jgi:hypothetical protein
MTHRQKVDRLIAELERRGVNRGSVAPPLFSTLWLLGLNVPPPYFLGFVPLTLLMGAPFGVLWGAVMWLVQWQFWHIPGKVAILGSVLIGTLFGLIMAGCYRLKAARLELPSWDCYPGTEQRDRRRTGVKDIPGERRKGKRGIQDYL